MLSLSVKADRQLEAGFADPPKSARPSTYYLLLNGYSDRARIDFELEAFHAAGVRGLCVFDMGARGPEGRVPPAGPAFLSEPWLDNFAHLLAKAGELDLDVQLAVSSSWDMGGPWVTPEHASKALYQATLQVEGPTRFEGNLPFPALARTAPRDQAGHPRYYSEAALLAIPNRERLPAHEFVFELPSDAGLPMDHVILYNVPDGFGARDFSVGVSTTDAADSSFTQMLRASLEPHANPQRFDFAPVPARYVRLRVHGGHGPEDGPVRLAEFEAYDTGGRNVAGGHAADRTREGARLVRTPGDLGTHLTPRLVWWPMAKPFIDYLSRCSFLLQQGLFVADVCYYYGDQGYNFVPPKHVDPSLGYGFDYDVTNAEVILQRMTVRDGRVTLPDGMRYELLVLPERDDIDPTVLRKVAELVEAGATVVGPKPTKATGLHQHVARDQAVRALAGKVWALAPIKANAGCCPGSIAAPPAPGRSGLHPGRGRAARPNPPGVQR